MGALDFLAVWSTFAVILLGFFSSGVIFEQFHSFLAQRQLDKIGIVFTKRDAFGEPSQHVHILLAGVR